MQYDMGAISKRTIMELSPYTTDSAQELQRLAEEGKSISDDTPTNSISHLTEKDGVIIEKE